MCELADEPAFRVALIRTAEHRHRFVLTNHHIVLDGWSLPILLGEVFASYHGQRLPTPAPYRSFVTWLAGRDLDAAEAAWREVLADFDTPTLVGPPARLGLGARGVASFRVPEETTRALSELARSHHTTVNTVLQAAFAQLLMWLTGQHDVAFGTVVSGRPAEVAGADSMVGLLINTVPVRATITAATTTADLLDQLQGAHNDTLEHQHLALSEIHRITGHDQLFDTLFVYENYPIDTAALSGANELAITEFTSREYNHYPLTVQATPGPELGLRVEFDTDVFDPATIDTLIERLQRVLVAMTADPTQRLSSMDVLDEPEHARLDEIGNRAVLTQPATAGVDSGVVRRTGGARPGGSRGDLRRPFNDLPRTRRSRQPVGAPAGRPWGGPGAVCGAAVHPFRARPSWRCWRCSRPGRRICRSTRWCRRPGSGSCSPTPRRSPRSPPRVWPARLDGCDLLVIDVDDPAH